MNDLRKYMNIINKDINVASLDESLFVMNDADQLILDRAFQVSEDSLGFLIQNLERLATEQPAGSAGSRSNPNRSIAIDNIRQATRFVNKSKLAIGNQTAPKPGTYA